ncbi:MAG: glucose-1-phosphate thymidylyltransferase [Chitinophagales bacterium]|jgi:UDP-N-acetylglucosamine diphosphorylase/glucosamine-1-phosphate N-acetyltransferase|nr:glucose-1-phosphate thymidylyltransferase [Chitinophagales bacterium]
MSNPHFILFDGPQRPDLLPITATRAIADLRIGILTIKEKWEKHLNTSVSILTQHYLQPKYPFQNQKNTIYINAAFLPNKNLVDIIIQLNEATALIQENKIIAFKSQKAISTLEAINLNEYSVTEISNQNVIQYPWDIFTQNGNEIKNDIQLLDLKPNPDKLSKTNILLGNQIYIADGATCEASVLNTKDGPIYLGKDSEVMEGCTIRAPFALGEHATLKMQTKIYGDTSIGPYCKVGGEVSNSVLLAYSNKGHDGFLGNSVIGEWCNLGADTNNSNLKNNYSKVKAYHYPTKSYINTNLQFCGLIMGDHAKAAINTQFNTGTVVGVFANVFSAGFPPKFIADFAWNLDVFQLEKAYEVAQRVMERRSIILTENDKNILKYIYENR